MGKFIDYQGRSKIKAKVAEKLNVTDVVSNGISLVDEYGVADVSGAVGTVKVYRGTTQAWDSQVSLVSELNAIYIYSDHDTYDDEDLPAIKIGDGTSFLIDMPFITDHTSELLNHLADGDIHVTIQEKTFWNNKVSCDESRIVPDNLLILKTN